MENIVSEPVETYNQIGLGLTNYVDTRKLSPILKWAGGKEQELKYILPNLPQEKFTDYYEPFVGGGAVYTAIQADKYFINDKSDELILLYRSLTNEDRNVFFQATKEIIHNWDLLSFVTKQNSIFFYKYIQKFFRK